MGERVTTLQDEESNVFTFWLRRALFVGPILFLVISALDFIVFPRLAPRFLLYRVEIAVLLIVILLLARRTIDPRLHILLGLLGVIASAITIEAMILQTGGHASPYAMGMILLIVCVHSYIRGSMRFHILAAAAIYSIYIVPIAVSEHITDSNTFFISNFFILAVIMIMLVFQYIASRNAREQHFERKRVEIALRESEARFRDVAAAAGEFVWEVDASARFTYLSERVAAITGFAREELLGRTPLDMVPPEEKVRLERVLGKIARNRACLSGKEQKLMHTSGGERYLRISGIPIVRDGELRGYRGTALDVTEQRLTADELDRYRRNLEDNVMRRTGELQETVAKLVREINERTAVEGELQRNRLFLNNILNSLQDPIMVLDSNLRILMVNRSFEEVFLQGEGIRFLEGTCHEVFYHISRSCPNCLSKTAMSTGKMACRTIHRGKGEARRWFEICAFPLATAEGRLIGSVHHMRDISGRKNAEEKIGKYQERLRTFAHQLISTEERERRRIAQALHDGFPQKLALSKMLLQQMQSRLPASSAASETFGRINELYDDMTREVRALTFELAPPVLYEVGLEPAVERLLRTMLSDSPIEWKFENWRSGPPLRGELASVLYAVVRELVMNVVKYAEARFLKVTVAEWAGMVLTVVQDDGKGMPEGAARQELREQEMSGFGLFSVRERLRHLNGRMEIRTGSGKGTIVSIEVPPGDAEGARAAKLQASPKAGNMC
jgi:PAS domain S-box-containing protein